MRVRWLWNPGVAWVLNLGSGDITGQNDGQGQELAGYASLETWQKCIMVVEQD